MQPKVTGTLDQAGASNIGLIQYAISAIELGQAEVIAISYGDNPRTGSRASYARPRGDSALAGLFGAPSSYAHGGTATHVRVRHHAGTARQCGAHPPHPRQHESERTVPRPLYPR
ncbi:hypothetical protein C2W62_45120 [Candidatus Entotheonella serta]|nr:hypothetical protein C2W62_45120 [Candidatus Entotheonella serta]